TVRTILFSDNEQSRNLPAAFGCRSIIVTPFDGRESQYPAGRIICEAKVKHAARRMPPHQERHGSDLRMAGLFRQRLQRGNQRRSAATFRPHVFDHRIVRTAEKNPDYPESMLAGKVSPNRFVHLWSAVAIAPQRHTDDAIHLFDMVINPQSKCRLVE